MNNNLLIALTNGDNVPLHITFPESVHAHLSDRVRLIVMSGEEWPKLRCRDLLPSNLDIKESYEFDVGGDKHTVDVVTVKSVNVCGKLIDGKYFFSSLSLNRGIDLELLFADFGKLGIRPMAHHEGNYDCPGASISLYTLVGVNENPDPEDDPYYEFDGLEAHGITTLADLMGQSYKFKWSDAAGKFVAVTDQQEIARRIRKPWMENLVHRLFGTTSFVSDHGKLIAFLLHKTKELLSEDEQALLSPFLTASPETWQLKNIAERQRLMNNLNAAYHSPTPLLTGDDVLSDPLFLFCEAALREGE